MGKVQRKQLRDSARTQDQQLWGALIMPGLKKAREPNMGFTGECLEKAARLGLRQPAVTPTGEATED